MTRTILLVVVGALLVATSACSQSRDGAPGGASPATTVVAASEAETRTVVRHVVFEHGRQAAADEAAPDVTRCARVLWSGNGQPPGNFDQAAQEELSAYIVGQKFSDCAGASAPAYWPEGVQVQDSAVGRNSRRQCIRVAHFNNEDVCFRLIPNADVD